jgi:hypothetical protein
MIALPTGSGVQLPPRRRFQPNAMKRSDAVALVLLLAACASAPQPQLSSIGGASAPSSAGAAATSWPPADVPLRDEEDRDPRWRY